MVSARRYSEAENIPEKASTRRTANWVYH